MWLGEKIRCLLLFEQPLENKLVQAYKKSGDNVIKHCESPSRLGNKRLEKELKFPMSFVRCPFSLAAAPPPPEVTIALNLVFII